MYERKFETKVNPLLDTLKFKLEIKKDTDLAKAMGFCRDNISKIRMGAPATDSFILKAYLISGIPIEHLIELVGLCEKYKNFKRLKP